MDTSTPGQSEKSRRPTSKATRSATGSQEWASGLTPYEWLVGLTQEKPGQDHAHASLSA